MKTGFAEININLPVGKDMSGYLLRSSTAEGIHDRLKIKTMVLDDGSNRIVLIVCDLLGLDHIFVRKTAQEIEKKLKINRNHIIIACTHTHSGPASMFLQDCGEVDLQWLEDLKQDILLCAAKALEKMKPSLLSYATGTSDIGYNRIYRKTGKKKQFRDSQVGILTVRDAESKEIDTLIVNYGCHPVALGPENLLYTRDYPFYLEESLKSKFPHLVNVVFFNSCCGDQTVVQRASFQAANNLGKLLCESVLNADNCSITGKDFEDAVISVEAHHISIPLYFDRRAGYFTDLKEKFLQELHDLLKKDPTNSLVKYNEAYIKWCDRMLEKLNNGTLDKNITALSKVIRIGRLNIITLPFEIFHDIGLELKNHFGSESTMVIGYADGDFGYLPSKRLYRLSRYEVPLAHRFYGYPGPVSRKAEDIIYQALFKHN